MPKGTTSRTAAFLSLFIVASGNAVATETISDDVKNRRGTLKIGKGTQLPTLTLTNPKGGWTTSRMVEVSGKCSDETADPILINMNGARYFVRSSAGSFRRSFPAAKGKNNVVVECANKGGTAKVTRTLDANISPVALKIVLTSDTDGVYTDLHIYEPDGAHIYWAETNSPTGGLFFLNQEEGSFDKPGYGPYLYVHPTPPTGTFRIDANYWPGGAVQHTLSTLDVVLDEGLPSEQRRRIQKPLARPGETATLAYVTFPGNRQQAKIFVPGQDPQNLAPPSPPTPKTGALNSQFRHLAESDEAALREAAVSLALQQARKTSDSWDPSQRDCAGLIRFAYREALKKRTANQRNALRLPEALPFPAVSESARRILSSFPSIWETGNRKDGSPVFGNFADAETLFSRNFRHKSRSLGDARKADILVFRRNETDLQPYHVMMFAGPEHGQHGVVVYHNGERGRDGQVRIVEARDLMESPDPTWIPSHRNPHFLGVYEWKMFRQKQSSLGPIAGGP